MLRLGPQAAGIGGGVGAEGRRRFDHAEPGIKSTFRNNASAKPDTLGLACGAAGSADDSDAGRQQD
jgi:hypothetical protein